MCELNHKITSVIPESGVLIILGFILGGIVWGADKAQTFKLVPVNFFFYLLPQIILDASYCMPNKLFFSNLGAILIHAVIATCWNAASVGIALWGCYEGGAMGKSQFYLSYLLLAIQNAWKWTFNENTAIMFLALREFGHRPPAVPVVRCSAVSCGPRGCDRRVRRSPCEWGSLHPGVWRVAAERWSHSGETNIVENLVMYSIHNINLSWILTWSYKLDLSDNEERSCFTVKISLTPWILKQLYFNYFFKLYLVVDWYNN